MTISFKDLRQNAHLSRAACAEYLKVNLSTVNRWDNGVISAPFAVRELLRVIAGELPALSLRDCFSGCRFGGDYLYTPEGERYTPEDIKSIRILYARLADHRGQILELEKRISAYENDKNTTTTDNVVSFAKYARS